MYVGTHYNSYYNSLFGDRGSVYGNFAKTKAANTFNPVNNSSVSPASVKYVQELKTGAGNLKKAVSALTSGTAFTQKTAVSSDNTAMTVKGGSRVNSKTTVRIEQIAAGQTNRGRAMSANQKSGLSGYQQFSIENNGRTYQFSINVGAGDSNKDVQQKMAAAINMRDIGINATVSVDALTGASTLAVQAQNTGDNQKSRFTIQDVYGSAVADTGADNVEQEAQNAVYSINGGAARVSQSNSVDIGNGLTATLLKATDKEIVASQAMDAQYAADKVKDLVSAYNQLYGAAFNNIGDNKANNLLSQLNSASRTYAKSLAQVGISFDSNGYMQADGEKLAKAAQDGSLERLFSGSGNYGFGGQMNRIAGNVASNTANYVSQSNTAQDLMNSVYNFNYKNNFNTGFNSGLLFDFLL